MLVESVVCRCRQLVREASVRGGLPYVILTGPGSTQQYLRQVGITLAKRAPDQLACEAIRLAPALGHDVDRPAWVSEGSAVHIPAILWAHSHNGQTTVPNRRSR